MSRWAMVAATSWLWLVCSLAAWSLLPLALGWQPVVVLSGSMEPAVRPGDIVLIDTVPVTLRPGQLVLVRDPGVPSGRLLHRVVRVEPDGVVTRGDANLQDDARRAGPRDVVGVARLVVPAAGRFVMLTKRFERGDVGWAIVTLCALVVVSTRRSADTDGEPARTGHRTPVAAGR